MVLDINIYFSLMKSTAMVLKLVYFEKKIVKELQNIYNLIMALM